MALQRGSRDCWAGLFLPVLVLFATGHTSYRRRLAPEPPEAQAMSQMLHRSHHWPAGPLAPPFRPAAGGAA